jgi:uncharacterized membrane protein YgcG
MSGMQGSENKGSPRKRMHGFRQCVVPCSDTGPDIALCSPESVCLVTDDLRLVVQSLHGAIVDGHTDAEDKIITIEMLDDDLQEGSEQFTVELFNHKRRNYGPYTETATVTIEDDESWALFDLSAASYTVVENAGHLTVNVSRLGLLDATSVWLIVADKSDDTATGGREFNPDGSDFYFVNVQLNFAAGETSKSVNVPIINDTLVEGDETFTVDLMYPGSNAQLGEISTAIATITDDDSSGGGDTGSGDIGTSSSGGGGGSLGLPVLFVMLLLRLLSRDRISMS